MPSASDVNVIHNERIHAHHSWYIYAKIALCNFGLGMEPTLPHPTNYGCALPSSPTLLPSAPYKLAVPHTSTQSCMHGWSPQTTTT